MFKQDSYAACDSVDGQSCEHCRTLRYDTNVLVLQRLGELSTLSSVNLCLSILCVMYLGVAIVCFIFTGYHGTTGHEATPSIDFHRLEFTATFGFTLVTTFALVFSPERRFTNALLLKVLVLLNVCASFVAMLFIYYSMARFEVLAHEIEYANELCTAVVDILIVLALQLDANDQQKRMQRSRLRIFGLCAAVVPAAQLLLFNAPWGGERPAHYLEFIVRDRAHRTENICASLPLLLTSRVSIPRAYSSMP